MQVKQAYEQTVSITSWSIPSAVLFLVVNLLWVKTLSRIISAMRKGQNFIINKSTEWNSLQVRARRFKVL